MSNKKEDDLEGYYVIKFERYIDLLNEIEHKYTILSDFLHEQVIKNDPDHWDETAIPAIAECFVTVHDLRRFLDDKINNTPEEEAKLAQKYNIKDILLKKEELQRMNVLLLAEEELEASLEINYKISLSTH